MPLTASLEDEGFVDKVTFNLRFGASAVPQNWLLQCSVEAQLIVGASRECCTHDVALQMLGKERVTVRRVADPQDMSAR